MLSCQQLGKVDYRKRQGDKLMHCDLFVGDWDNYHV